jgi:hypothetical protein
VSKRKDDGCHKLSFPHLSQEDFSCAEEETFLIK